MINNEAGAENIFEQDPPEWIDHTDAAGAEEFNLVPKPHNKKETPGVRLGSINSPSVTALNGAFQAAVKRAHASSNAPEESIEPRKEDK